MSLNDFHRNTTLVFNIVSASINGVIADISADTMTFYLKDETKIILSSSADMVSGSLGEAYFNISSSLTNLPAECYQYNILWHRSNGEDYLIDKSSLNIKEIISGSV